MKPVMAFVKKLQREWNKSRKQKNCTGLKMLIPKAAEHGRALLNDTLQVFVKSKVLTHAYIRRGKKGLWITMLWEKK